ncbi:MAG: phosphoribosylamine--glycine ligase [Clostridiales bacterium]|nr:phosphoribosylamine--glycine ligase [Clostridiales bacterium]
MKIMVVGGGGREHTIVKKLKESPKVDIIYALPGNGGIAAEAICVDIGAKDIPAIVDFAKQKAIDLAVVAPDDPLVLGAVDELEKAGIPCFGPNKSAAIIEGSKVFSKNFMKKYGIPTAKYEFFSDLEKALDYLNDCPYPTVIKADGLALGKGVIIAETAEEGKKALISIMQDKVFGESGNQVVIEEFLEGPEVSVLCFTDGKFISPMVSSMDHKRAHDNDEGPNTGGMGVIAPSPYYTDSIAKQCMEKIFLPTISAMKDENREFKGCLYFGLMLTKSGPKVIEYNCRFGDPETQAVLPLLESDLVDIMLSTREGRLAEQNISFKNAASCCLVMASGGYPEKYEKGKKISLPESLPEDTDIYFAGVKLSDGQLLTSGGRVLGITSVSNDLKSAIDAAYKTAENISFDGAFYRRDIGEKALKACNIGG